MKKTTLLLVIFLYGVIRINAQSIDIPVKQSHYNSNTKLFVSLGLNSSSFQDVKYSSVRNSGIGGLFNIGFSKNKPTYYWEAAININYNIENAATHENASATVMQPNVNFKYLRTLKKNNNFKIGARLDLLDVYLRTTQNLGNNSSYVLFGNTLYASMQHNYTINDKWNLQSELDLGIIGVTKESTSFAFSAPQVALENGDFNYQNEGLSNPFTYKFSEFNYLGNQLNIKTAFLFQYKKRLSLGYLWNMRRFSTVKSYPTTIGLHNIIIRYNIISN